MQDDEREMLIRVDDRLDQLMAKHSTCDIPLRLRSLENDRNKFVGVLTLLFAMVTLNTAIDLIIKIIYNN